MSKGTKQIRLGRVDKFILQLEERLLTQKELLSQDESFRYLEGQVYELETIIKRMRREFELEG